MVQKVTANPENIKLLRKGKYHCTAYHHHSEVEGQKTFLDLFFQNKNFELTARAGRQEANPSPVRELHRVRPRQERHGHDRPQSTVLEKARSCADRRISGRNRVRTKRTNFVRLAAVRHEHARHVRLYHDRVGQRERR